MPVGCEMACRSAERCLLTVLLALHVLRLSHSYIKLCSETPMKFAIDSLSCCQLTDIALDKDYINCYNKTMQESKLRRKVTMFEAIDIAVCTQECFYTTHTYMDVNPPYELSYVQIRMHLMKTQPVPKTLSVRFMLEAYQVCEQFYTKNVTNFDIQYPRSTLFRRYCNPYAQQIASCVRIYAMQQCPDRFWDSSKERECPKAKLFYKKCLVDIKDSTV